MIALAEVEGLEKEKEREEGGRDEGRKEERKPASKASPVPGYMVKNTYGFSPSNTYIDLTLLLFFKKNM